MGCRDMKTNWQLKGQQAGVHRTKWHRQGSACLNTVEGKINYQKLSNDTWARDLLHTYN